jgi:hypothetical protein
MILRRLLSGVTTLLWCLSPLPAIAQPTPASTGMLTVPPAVSPPAPPSPAPAPAPATAPAPPATTPFAWQQRPAPLAAASAPPPDSLGCPAPPPVVSESRSSYSGQIVLADATWVSTLLLAAKAEDGGVAVVGGLGYFLAAPSVHLAHRRPKTALASVVLRVGMPLIGAALGAATFSLLSSPRRCDHQLSDCSGGPGDAALYGGLFGGFLGVVVAPAVDASLLARVNWFDKPRSEPAAQAMPTPTTFRFSGTF